MPTIERDVLEIPTGYRSQEVASFIAQLNDQSARLLTDLEGITTAELEWQPARGMNTIGMLLAHNAIVEVIWIQAGPQGKDPVEIDPVLGVTIADDGIPLAPDGDPPAVLAGKPFEFYRELLAKARAYATRTAQALEDRDLTAMRRRTRRRDGQVQEVEVRWVLYHMLEHFAGHYGQILLLRHLYKAAPSGDAKGRTM
jgi:uncharacterized damage-inducible protein DinB